MDPVSCQCGSDGKMIMEPDIDFEKQDCIRYRVECPTCGPKKAPWKTCEVIALSQWVTEYSQLNKDGEKIRSVPSSGSIH